MKGTRPRLLLVFLLAIAVSACRSPDAVPPPAAATGQGGFVADRSLVSPVLIVGIDGATFDRILPLSDQGRLPRLTRLMEQGAWGPLTTIEPTVSPAIWTTIATGRLPAEHGILGFDGVPGHSMTTLPTSGMRKVRAFWNIFSERGRSVGIIGWWATWPAEPVNGYVISDRTAYTRMEATLGADAPQTYDIYPPELAPRVRERVRSPNAISAEEVRRFMPLSDDEVARLIRGTDYRHGDLLPEFKYVHQSDRSSADIALDLMRSHPTDVTAVAFYGVDTVSHLAWHYMEPERFPHDTIDEDAIARFGGLIDHYYEFVDRLLGELIDAAPVDATVMVFSDHGFGPTGRLPWSGGHGRITPGAPIAPPGVWIMAGPPIRTGVRLEHAHVLDIAPTLLYLQGLPLAKDMPGGVFGDSLEESFLSVVPLREVPTFETGPRESPQGAPLADPRVDAAARERLCALGYIECE